MLVRKLACSLPCVLLMLASSCSVNQVPNRHSELVPYQRYALKADLWLLQAQLDSGLLPYFYLPSTEHSPDNDYLLAQMVTAERFLRLSKKQTRFEAASQALIENLASPMADRPLPYQKVRPTLRTLGEQAAWLRLQLLLPSNESRSKQIEKDAEALRNSFHPTLGFPSLNDQAGYGALFMQRYFTGHAALALLRHSEATGSGKSDETASAVLNWLDQRYPSDEKDNFHPTHAPWHAFAIAEQYRIQGASLHLDTLFSVCDELVSLQVDRDFPGRFFNPANPSFGRPNIVRDALSTIAIMDALVIAVAVNDHRRQKHYRKAIRLSLNNLRAHQYDYGLVGAFDQPRRAIGALRFRYDEERIRLDGVVYGATAFERAAELMRKGIL